MKKTRIHHDFVTGLAWAWQALLLIGGNVALWAQNPSVVWSQRFDGAAHLIDAAQVVKIASNGDVIVAGRSERSTDLGDLFVMRYAGDTGAMVWQRRLSAPTACDDVCRAMVLDQVGNVLLAGVRYDATGFSDIMMAKIAGDTGSVLWTQTYAGSAGDDDDVAALDVDAQNNLIVAGSTTIANGTVQQLVMKRSSATGALAWSLQTNAVNGQRSVDVSVDQQGRVLVGAVALNALFKGDMIITQYNGSSGEQNWRASIDGAAQGDDQLSDISINSSNDVIVCGAMEMSNGARRGVIAKCAASNGTVLWQRLQSSVISSSESGAKSLALDAQGDVAVVGKISSLSVTGNDWWAAKCVGDSGQLIWEQRLTSATSGEALVVKVNEAGHLLVAGRVDVGPGNADFKTVKLAGTTGSVIWQQVQAYGASSNDLITDLALGAGSRVAITGRTNDDWWTHVLFDQQPQLPILRVTPLGSTEILDGATVVFGTTAAGVELRQQWQLTNAGTSTWQRQALVIDGAHASDWSVTQQPASTLAPGASTTLELRFAGVTAGTRSAALHFLHNDTGNSPFDVALQAVALSSQNDSDGDGLNDVAEWSLASLGFLWQQSQVPLVQSFKQGVAAAGYIAPEQIESVKLTTPLLQRDPVTGLFQLQLKLQRSVNLSQWSNLVPAQVNWSVGSASMNVSLPANSNATQFFRLQGDVP